VLAEDAGSHESTRVCGENNRLGLIELVEDWCLAEGYFLVSGMPTRLPLSIPIWLRLPNSYRGMSLISVVSPSVDGSACPISR
jgi:hypothetical protein